MLRHRILSALAGIPLFVLAAWWRGIPLLVLTAALYLLALMELTRIFNRTGLRIPSWFSLSGGVILFVAAYVYRDSYPGSAVVVLLCYYLCALVFLYPRLSVQAAAAVFLATCYTGLIIYLYLLGTDEKRWIWLFFVLICTWASDTCAYFIGRKWGRRPLAPLLSPNKTLEGASAGIAGSLVVAVLFGWTCGFDVNAALVVLGLLVGVAAQLGDLVESVFKRQARMKDASSFIPGHGGVLDRFDSMLFTAPLVYYYVGAFMIR